MNEKQTKHALLRELTEESIPANRNPWQVMQARIEREGENGSWQPKVAAKSVSVRFMNSLPVAVALLFIMLGFFLLVSPQGYALAQGVLRFFQPVQEPGVSSPAVSTPLPLVDALAFERTSNPGQKNSSLEEAQDEIDYPLMQLALLPRGYYFESVQVDGERVTLSYKNDAKGISLWLEQSPLRGAEPKPMDVGAAALVESAQVGNDPAEYVQGSYSGEQGEWNAASGASFLRWQHGDRLYTISAVINPYSTAAGSALPKETLLALAENLTDDLSTVQSVDADHIDSLAEAEKLAGFRLRVPEILPMGYQFDFATVEDGTGFVCLQYAYNGASYPSLFIRESVTAPLTALQAGANSTPEISPVEIAGSEGEGQYVTGFDTPVNACGPQNNIFRAAQALLWESGGMSLELYAEFYQPEGGAGLSQAQLVVVAESAMNRMPSGPVMLDTNSYHDLVVAEYAAGYAIQMPAKLPLGSVPDSIHVLGNSSMTLFINSQFGSPNIRLYQCPVESTEETPCQRLMDNIPEDFQTSLMVGQVKATYAQGDFGLKIDESNLSWHASDPSQTQRMYWQTGTWAYLLVSTGEGVTQQSLVEIANTVP